MTTQRNHSFGFGRLIKPEQKRAAKATGYALTLGDTQAMSELAKVLFHLQPPERVLIAVAAIFALPDDEYQAVIDFVEGDL